LDEDVQHFASAINHSPQPIFFATYWKDVFFQQPFVRHFWAISADHIGISKPELRNPSADGLVAANNATRGQQVLDIAQIHGKW